jgi:hypothetical protein
MGLPWGAFSGPAAVDWNSECMIVAARSGALPGGLVEKNG